LNSVNEAKDWEISETFQDVSEAFDMVDERFSLVIEFLNKIKKSRV
jgi:hypothetical protein